MEFSKYIPQSKQDVEEFLIIDSENESQSCEQIKPRLSLISRKTCPNCNTNRKYIKTNQVTNRSYLELSNFEQRSSLQSQEQQSAHIDREILKAKEKLKLSVISCDMLQKIILQLVQQEAALKVEKYKRSRNKQVEVQRVSLGDLTNGVQKKSIVKQHHQKEKQKKQKVNKNEHNVSVKKFKTKQQSTPKYKKNLKKKCP